MAARWWCGTGVTRGGPLEGAVSTVQARTLARTWGDTCTHVHTGAQVHRHDAHTHTPVPVALVAMEQVRGPGQPGTRATRGVTVADTGGRERRHFSRQHMSLQGSRNKKAKNASMALRRSGRHDPALDVRPGDLRRSLLRASPSRSRTHSALRRGPGWDGAHGIGYRRGNNVTSGRSGTVRWGEGHGTGVRRRSPREPVAAGAKEPRLRPGHPSPSPQVPGSRHTGLLGPRITTPPPAPWRAAPETPFTGMPTRGSSQARPRGPTRGSSFAHRGASDFTGPRALAGF